MGTESGFKRQVECHHQQWDQERLCLQGVLSRLQNAQGLAAAERGGPQQRFRGRDGTTGGPASGRAVALRELRCLRVKGGQIGPEDRVQKISAFDARRTDHLAQG